MSPNVSTPLPPDQPGLLPGQRRDGNNNKTVEEFTEKESGGVSLQGGRGGSGAKRPLESTKLRLGLVVSWLKRQAICLAGNV